MKKTTTYYIRKNDANSDIFLENAIAHARALDRSKNWQIEIGPEVKERTSQQNKTLFGHAYRILQEQTGYSKEWLHERFCRKYFGTRVISGRYGKEMLPVRTTTHDENGNKRPISTVEFMEFYDAVTRYAALADVFIPDPDPQWRENMRVKAESEQKESEHASEV